MESGLSVKNLREIPLTQPSAMEASNGHVAEAGRGHPVALGVNKIRAKKQF
jgi:hypothetical protein